MSRLTLTLFGSLTITLDGRPVTRLESDKVRGLLARLALEPERAFRRETLSALFWPESSPSRAAQNLRQSLYALRQAIGESFLLVTPQTVQFNTAADVEVDVLTWHRLLAEVQSHHHRRRVTCRPCLERLAQALDLYRGDLLVGFAFKDCPEFEDWLTVERERLHVQALESLTLLADDAERRGDYPTAQAYLRRQLALEPWQEEAHRHLMRLLALEGRRAAALEQFEVCRRTLADELGLAPTEETRTLYVQIRAGAPLPAPAAIPPDLPIQLTSFVGREAELALLAERLANPDHRLITLTGPGGIGKTRLALQVAAAQADQFVDGVCWVPLTDAQSDTDLALAVAHALHLSLSGAQDIRAQLLRALRDDPRERLLVLDNFEQLLPASGVQLVLDILRAAPQTTLLVTSRQRLNLQAESVLPLEGLACAETAEGTSDAAQLFAERAGRVRLDFAVAPAQQAAVTEICRLVEGSPLGIELAAAWAGEMSPARIADEIKSTLDFLTSDHPDLPERHRSLRAVFESSWKLLAEAEQAALMQVAAFRGGFRLEAAQVVADVSAQTLRALARKSLLVWDEPHARYALHADIRHYAAGKLEAQPSLAQQVRARHAAFFADFLRQREGALRGPQQVQVQAEIESEQQNILAAWEWALAQRDTALLARLVHGLFAFYESKAWFREGVRILQPALDWAREASGADPDAARHQARRLRRLLGRQAALHRQMGQYEQALALLEAGLALPGLPSDEEHAFLLLQRAWVAFLQAQYAQARMWAEAGLARYRALGQLAGSGDGLALLGWTAYELGDYAAAEALCREAQAVCEQTGYAWGVQYAVYGLGLVKRAQGDYATAQQCFRENLAFCEQIGYLWGMAQAYINLGLTALAQGEAQTAEGFFRQSLSLSESIEHRWGIAQSYKGLGEVTLAGGDCPAAQTWAQRSLALYQQMQDHDGQADCLLILSAAAQGRGDPAAAWQALEQAEALIRASENGFRAARALCQRAKLLLQEGETAQAQELLLQTLRHPACERHIYDHAVAALSALLPP